MAGTLVDLFFQRIEQFSDQTAVVFQQNGELQVRSWSDVARDVFCVVQGLAGLGIGPGDRVAHLSENRYEWILSDLAIQLSQAIHVPIHAPLAAEQVEYQIVHSGAKSILISNAEQCQKLKRVETQLPNELRVVVFDADDIDRQVGRHDVVAIQEWLTGASPQAIESGRQLGERSRQSLRAEDLGTILYTSGTTGQPKGVMLTQANLTSNAIGTVDAFGMTADDVRLNFLPLSHIFARTCDLYTWLANGSQLCLATNRDTVVADCQWAKPTLISGVPYFFDRIRRYLVDENLHDTAGSLRGLLGGNIKYCCSGGAALPDHVFDFYESRDVPILQGYGLTETSPVISLSSPDAFRRGASGRAIRDVEVAIAEDGEIITRGPHIMRGYWQDDKATQEAIVEGWFYTGDYGKVDDDGYVWITGRKKELIVTAAGKNVAPVLLESLLTEDPLIEQAVVIGDGRSYLSALIVPDWAAIERSIPIPLPTSGDLAEQKSARDAARQDVSVLELVQKQIDQRLACVSYHEQVRKFTLLANPFTIESHEMTPKLSLRRPVIHEHYRDVIEAMYEK